MSGNLAPADASGLFFPHEVNNERDAILANVRAASALGLPELKQYEFSETPLAIVAGGPSIDRTLPILRAMLADSHVMAVNGAYPYLRARGIDPEHFVLLDSRADNVCHVISPSEKTNHLLASQVHPDVFSRLRDYRITLFHAGTETTLEVLGDQDKDFLTAPIGMASVHAVYIAAALGYRNMMLFGYDFSHDGEKRYAFNQPMNGEDGTMEVRLDGEIYRTTISLARTADQFVNAVSPVIRGCDLNIRLCSRGLLAAMLKHAANVPDEASERAKYRQIWGEVDAYRRVCPALEYVEDAMQRLGMQPGDSVLDLGCGTGRAARWFTDHGMVATGVDIAENALEEDVPFACQALWDPLPKAKYGFSTDVLEHIPPEYVRQTLKQIHDATEACYLNIDTVPDSFGVTIGQRLHLTVMSAESWRHELGQVWPDVQAISTTDKQAIFICRR